MEFNHIKSAISSLQNNKLQGIMFIALILVSVYVPISIEPSDTRAILLLIISLIAVCLAFIVFHSTKTWVPILICLMLVRDLSMGDLIGGGSLKVGDIFIALMFSVWMLNNIFIKNSNRLLKSNLDLVLVLFLFFYISSLFWSTDLEYGLLRVSKLIRNFCFYILIRDLFIKDFEDNFKRITLTYIITGIVLLIMYMSVVFSSGGFSDFLSLGQKETLTSVDMGALRRRGTGGGVLITGPSAWFVMGGVMVFGSLMMTGSRIQRLIKTLFIILFFGAATALTLSRTTAVMVGVILVVLLLGSLKLRLRKNISALLLILSIFAVTGITLGFTQIYSKRFANMFEDHSWVERVEYYQAATDAFNQSPVWGIGAGSNFSWQEKYPGLEQSRIVHSLPLLILSETGLLGFVIFIMIAGYWLKYLWDCMHHRNAGPYFQAVSLTMFAFTIGYFSFAWTVGEFEEFEPWLVLGIASALKNLHSSGVGKADNAATQGFCSLHKELPIKKLLYNTEESYKYGDRHDLGQ